MHTSALLRTQLHLWQWTCNYVWVPVCVCVWILFKCQCAPCALWLFGFGAKSTTPIGVEWTCLWNCASCIETKDPSYNVCYIQYTLLYIESMKWSWIEWLYSRNNQKIVLKAYRVLKLGGVVSGLIKTVIKRLYRTVGWFVECFLFVNKLS